MLLPEKYESIFDVSSKGPSSGSLVKEVLLNFPTKGLCSKRRRYFHIFQVEAYLTYCEDCNKHNQTEAFKGLFQTLILVASNAIQTIYMVRISFEADVFNRIYPIGQDEILS